MRHTQERGTRCLLSATPVDGQAPQLGAQEHADGKQLTGHAPSPGSAIPPAFHQNYAQAFFIQG